MDVSRKILSDLTVYMKYSRYLEDRNRRETWEEIVSRNKNMHIKKFPRLEKEIHIAYEYVYNKKILPSMRSIQFAGKAIEVSPARLYNCSFAHIDSIEAFSEAMFLLLSGCGFGYSVQSNHIDKLPEIRKPNFNRRRRYLVSDNIAGWADAIKVLLKSYTGRLSSTIEFDYRDIRAKGTPIVTGGGTAPGPQPLKECLVKIRGILDNKEERSKLSPLECHDILCHIANAVLSGGVRRASMISLFDIDDEEMLACKTGNWWELNPQRALANNSAVVLRHLISEDKFKELWERTKLSKAGEPGIFLTNDKDWGINPCGEIGLRSNQFCNLVTINGADIESQEDFNNRVKAASFIATLQASYTDFHYLRDIWKRVTEKEALIGVSITGISAELVISKYNMEEAAKIAVQTNIDTAMLIGINSAARVTCVKPEGTSSLVLGTASGVHAYYDKYYIRRLRVNKDEDIYQYLLKTNPDLIEDEYFNPSTTAVISIPQKAPEGAILRTEEALNLLERVKYTYQNWIQNGHVKGQNTNNVSATINVREDEWSDVIQWMWDNREYYTGITVLPADSGTYKQTPFESISEDKYNEMYKLLNNIDLTQVIEDKDNTTLQSEVACGGSGSCEIL